MVEAELFSPFVSSGDGGDWVPPEVIEDEMSLFSAFARQNETLGG